MIFARELGNTLRHCLETDPRTVILGEDILDPYGGAFKVTQGLSTDYPERVYTTPVSEAAIAGIAAGLALGGWRPITEIMFGDFIALCFDQIMNHIAKYEAIYNGRATCPVIIRTPSGGHRGYGPTHSQSLEKHFLGIPQLRIVAASLYHDPKQVFEHFLQDDSPVLYFEHKLLYPQPISLPANGQIGDAIANDDASPGFLPTVCLSYVPREECTTSILAYGYQASLAAHVLEKLAMEEEIFAELLVPAQIAPMDWGPIERSVRITGSLVTIEEGTGGWSWGTEAAAVIGKALFGKLRRPVEILASERTVIPSAKRLEGDMLVGPKHIERTIREAAS